MKTSFSNKKIVIIGAGNLATQLGLTLKKTGYTILQVYSPTRKSAQGLAKKLKSNAITDLEELDRSASVYIISIKDDAISSFAKELILDEQLVVHTSGTVDAAVLKNCSKNYGVFYPLQTFSKDKVVDFKNVPLCIESNTTTAAKALETLAKSISSNVQPITAKQRRILHVSAVFACNFSNHMYTISASILSAHHLSFELLKPLIAETADKIKKNDPPKMQTGPAIRKDIKTMNAHLKLLSNNKELKTIYKLVSEHIMQQ
jgi:predicted short-subunit dehydrogenase-like oxidoreductase (DUF2520 family)